MPPDTARLPSAQFWSFGAFTDALSGKRTYVALLQVAAVRPSDPLPKAPGDMSGVLLGYDERGAVVILNSGAQVIVREAADTVFAEILRARQDAPPDDTPHMRIAPQEKAEPT